MQIKEILKLGVELLREKNIEEPNLKVKMLLSDVLNKTKEYLIIHDEEEVNENEKKVFLEKIERLRNYEPIQYILNRQEFMGFSFSVNENVLIPQPDTENLVEEVLHIADKLDKDINEEIRILDLCTGSGAIAISIAKLLGKKVLVYASDISAEALKVAEENSMNNMANIYFFKSNLFEKISNLYKFDIIVSNPPYIETKKIENLPEEVKREPKIALDGGEDGLKFYKEISKEAKKYLLENGYLAFEIGYNQREYVESILKQDRYKNIYSRKDLSGNDRVVIAQK
jgi:protein-(glutamine-N5) methyltransferase, release factor-specific